MVGGGRTVAVVAVLELLAVAACASLWWESVWRDGGSCGGGDDKWRYVAVVSVAMEALTAVALGVGAGSSDTSRASCIGIVCGGEEAGGSVGGCV